MTIKFRFNIDKAAHTIAYLLHKIGPTDKIKITKLVYLADREHFIEHGYPITGDDQYAMRKGPVPSCTLDALDGDFAGAEEKLFAFVHVDDFKLSLKKIPEPFNLTDVERQTLDKVIFEHGSKHKWDLVNETHELPEYLQTYVPGTSTRIPYELVARVCGNESRFRKNRVVISHEAAARMDCPFELNEGL